MKIRKIEVRNYRSLRNLTICPEDILALVGRNNSGKSNLIKALELFFEGSTKLVIDECFFNHATDKAIEIFITFEALSDWEKVEFGPWMYEDKLVVGREIVSTGIDSCTINNIAVTKAPAIEWLRVDVVNGDKIKEWWADKDQLTLNGASFVDELGPSKPTVARWKEAINDFVEKHRDRIPFKDEVLANPKGYPGVLKGALPEFIHVPAVRDISDEAKVAKKNPFGQLINSVLEKVSGQQKLIIAEELKKIERKLNRAGGKERIAQIREIEDRLNKLMYELMDCDIEIEMAMPQLKEVFGGATIYAHDGVRTAIEAKGHGLQRSMIFTILRAYAELSHVQKADKKAGERTTIFCIEEPELYLHPQSQRTLMSVFRKIASGRDQVIYSTHSSLFVDMSHFDEICVIRREKVGKLYESSSTQLSVSDMLEDLKARKGVDGTDKGIREQYSHAFNAMVNEGFFADKVIIAEGPSEQYSIPIYGDALGYNLDQNGISVVHSDGKGQMDRLLRVFNGFHIPTYVVFDGDKDNEDKAVKDKTLELLDLLGNPVKTIEDVETNVSDRYAVFENKLEETLKDEVSDYEMLVQQAGDTLGPVGKPLKHRFVAATLRRRIEAGADPEDTVPSPIRDIITQLKSLRYPGSILKRMDTD